ncbi:formylglycine-generating enzyme family protein [Paraliomyxa miuraensis]|uniref:formylglycine-generating enzyme family protein n=1 Tax=Paraliomyxa miuraensis TaxID=376150 RepID=UPI00224D424A|nr:formylglycine-generating enzyme family protein [Paraliomyxa miuraensis]MCX4240129.1 formylglycine-generating enzyme family protein [Paraliomyxa miuraensis]
MVDGTSQPLADGSPEDWASSWGEDDHGVFMGFTVGGVEQRLRWVGPGTFWMGSPEGELGRMDDEGPRHSVGLTGGFWIADIPVTQALWMAVMGKNPSHFEGYDTRPVENVSWDDCQAFCEELNRRIPGLGARLPSEAEWEHACRAGTTTATYAGDLDDMTTATALESIAWYTGNSDGETHPVKQKQPNARGLYDMLGNVWEWCQDYAYRRYTSEPQEDPRGPATGGRRVIRGGSWHGRAGYVRAACRLGNHPGYGDQAVGLRLVRDQAKPD